VLRDQLYDRLAAFQIGAWINQAIEEVMDEKLPDEKEKRSEFMKDFRTRVTRNKKLLIIASKVKSLCKKFPVP